MSQELSYRDFPGNLLIRIIRPIFVQSRVQRELPSRGELHDRDLREDLVYGPEVESCLDVVGSARFAIRHSVGALKDGFVTLCKHDDARKFS
jgi:hypothetical protein